MSKRDRQWILLGDPVSERRESLRQLLLNEFDAQVTEAGTFDELFKHFRDAEQWHAVIFSEDLPESFVRRRPHIQFFVQQLMRADRSVKLICACADGVPRKSVESLNPGTGKSAVALVRIPADTWSNQTKDAITGQLIESGLEWIPATPKVTFDGNDAVMLQSLRQFDPEKKVDEGERVIGALSRRFFVCDEVAVGRLSQGLSGASVFLITPKVHGEAQHDYVLKISAANGVGKLIQEITGQALAEQNLGIQEFTRHIPRLRPRILFREQPPGAPHSDVLRFRYVAQIDGGRWVALCFDFLGGGRFGRFLDLETALLAHPKELREKTRRTELDQNPPPQRRLKVLNRMLEWLCRQWYCNPKRIRREPCRLWSVNGASPRPHNTLPPYTVDASTQSRIVDFLWSNQSLGERLIPTHWTSCCQQVQSFVTQSDLAQYPALLNRELDVLLSPVHGDLNSNNQFLWLEEELYPFLIDFPFFQAAGHALQDFARLEVELKFILLDRQRGPGSPPAFDLTYSQIGLWIQLDQCVMERAVPAKTKSWKAGGAVTTNVNVTLALLHRLRSIAFTVQSQRQTTARTLEFFHEYLPPLLYHTLRMISYPTQPVFKRLYATCSAARILKALS